MLGKLSVEVENGGNVVLEKFGIVLMVCGAIQLLFNEVAVQMKRTFKPWWRNPHDPEKDRKLQDLLRITTYLVAVLSIEAGIMLSKYTPLPFWIRCLAYLIAAVLLILCRPSIFKGWRS